MIADEWQQRLSAAGITDMLSLLDTPAPNECFGGHWTALTKPGLGRRERWRWEPTGDTLPLYVKRYLGTPWRAQWDRVYRQVRRRSRAWWEFAQSQRLNEQSIAAVRAVAAVESMRGCWERRSAVVFAEAPGDAFDRIWPAACARGAAVTRGRARHAVLRKLARFISAFHGTGMCHRDLYLCHIFVELDEAAHRPPRFTLLDLARVHRPRMRRMRWILKDLSQVDTSARQIGLTRADRLRLLIAYLGVEPRTARVRWYVRRIVRRSDRILRRIARKSRSA